jgi:hypothetical protein
MSKPVIAAILARLEALERAFYGEPHERLSKSALAKREGITPRSVDRRVVAGTYAQPEIENGRLYWWSHSYRLTPGTADTPAMRAARNPRLRGKPATVERIQGTDTPAARNPRLRGRPMRVEEQIPK